MGPHVTLDVSRLDLTINALQNIGCKDGKTVWLCMLSDASMLSADGKKLCLVCNNDGFVQDEMHHLLY